MAAFNRNIITSKDIGNLIRGDIPVTLDAAPPAAAPSPPPATPPDTSPSKTGETRKPGETSDPIVPTATADEYLTKLLKFVPLEVLGIYVFIAGVIEANVSEEDRGIWLLWLLVGIVLVTIPYMISVLSVKRGLQIAMSVVGIAVYVFAMGDWFETTTWYEPWYATIALPLFGLLVGIIQLPPLPIKQT